MQPNAQSNAVALSTETRIGGRLIPATEIKNAVYEQVRARLYLAQNVSHRRMADGSVERYVKEEIEVNGIGVKFAVPKWKYPDTPEQYREKLKSTILNGLHILRTFVDRAEMAAVVDENVRVGLEAGKK